MAVRDQVNAALEEKRKNKIIGNSLGASVLLTASGPIAALLEQYREQLPTLFIVSDLTLHLGDATGADQVRVDVGKANGVKCGRCWRYVPSVRTEPDWSGICDRCVGALAEPVNS
jgi:isoleucyl-tRNA synthetase